MPELRQNIITGEWVVIAPERSKRPDDFIRQDILTDDNNHHCVFCVSSENYKLRLKESDTENTYILPNKFPAFIEDKSKCSIRSFKTEDHFYTAKPAIGGHDVIIVKNHSLNLYHFNHKLWLELLDSFKKRYLYWRNSCSSEYSMAIYNHGHLAGASIYHPHAQLLASDIIPNQVLREINNSQQYFSDKGMCVFCQLIKHEQNHKIRIIAENNKFIAFTFYAARFPYEIWILPKHHQSNFESEGYLTLKILSQILTFILEKLNKTLRAPALNLYIHDSPLSYGETKYYHWHIEINPRVTNFGGYELGSGVIIDVQSPEEAASFLNR